MDSSRQVGGGQRKPWGIADTTYYPDLVDGGGLTSVLQAVAVAGDYDAGRIDGQSSGVQWGGHRVEQAIFYTGTSAASVTETVSQKGGSTQYACPNVYSY